MKALPLKKFRRPTVDEMEARMKSVLFWFGFAVYAVIGGGGSYAFMKLVHDAAWQEIFLGVWWLPSGFVAYLCYIKVLSWAVAWVPDEDPDR